MLNVSDTIKNLYKSSTPKSYSIDFPAITIENEQLVQGGFSLEESLCSTKDIKFGACEASEINFTVADVEEDLTGLDFTVVQNIGGNAVPFGKYAVVKCLRQNDRRFKEITAYDTMVKFDADVAAWYNNLAFPLNLAQFRSSFLAYVGLTQDASKLPLPNDSLIVTKTIEPTSLPGRTVIEAIEEINGVFGIIGRDGKFKHVILKPVYGDYPTSDYPTSDYPVPETDTSYVQPDFIDETITEAMRRSVKFEEYTVKEIDKLIIRTDDDDIGAIVGTGTNAYIIQGNFLVYGKSASELQTIAKNAFGYMAKRPYRPFASDGLGLPYIEPGDTLKFDQTDPVIGYMLNRTLKGIQSLMDEYGAPGSQERPQKTDTNAEIKMMQAKMLKIRKDVEGVSIEVSDLAENTATQFEQTSNSIGLKVSKDSIIQSINLSDEGLKIDVTKLDITGLVTITSLNTPGSVEIDGGNLKAGTVVADTVKSTWVYANDITADQINGGIISGVTFVSSSPSVGSLEINGAYIRGKDTLGNTKMDIYPGGIDLTGNLNCNTVNGYEPVTNGNIGSKSVSYANSAGSTFDCDIAYNLYNTGITKKVYISADDNFRPGTPLQGSCGSSIGLWTAVYAQNGTIQTSDRRKKANINPLAEKYLLFSRMVLELPRTFTMTNGQSGRTHIGFIAQDIEDAMTECGITDMEFAGLIKSPVYASKLLDAEGNEIDEYDTTSDIIDYSYGLRYDEFIPMLFALYADLIKI